MNKWDDLGGFYTPIFGNTHIDMIDTCFLFLAWGSGGWDFSFFFLRRAEGMGFGGQFFLGFFHNKKKKTHQIQRTFTQPIFSTVDGWNPKQPPGMYETL